MKTPEDVLNLGPVIPVVAIDEIEHAAPLARALLRGGIRTIEVTLRTPVAISAIERLAHEVPEIVTGAGTITQPGQAEKARAAGAQYLVTPGCTEQLLEEIEGTDLFFLGGVSTVSEAMRLAERGTRAMKFFPAEASGGVNYVRALTGPLPEFRFCPTGGVTTANAGEYLALPNVPCVGGSWLATKELLTAGHWSRIEELAQQAANLGKHIPKELRSF